MEHLLAHRKPLIQRLSVMLKLHGRCSRRAYFDINSPLSSNASERGVLECIVQSFCVNFCGESQNGQM